MTENKADESCCSPAGPTGSCCKVEAVVGIDERGQMVLPKDLREKANIHAGDKLAVVSMIKGDKTCYLTLFKVDELADMVKDMLGPVMEEIINR